MKRFVSWCLAVAVVAGAWIIPVQAINVGIVIQAEEYISGGEGIGYHDTTPGLDDKWAIDRGDDVEILAGNSGMVVSFQATEWMNYQVAVPQSGRYRLSVEYSSVGYVDGYQNELEVIINGHKQIGQHFGTTETWKKYRSEVLGEITLVSGENEIKLRNRGDGGISFDSFRLEQVGQISMEKEQEILLALNSTENSRSVLEQYQHEIGINVNQMLEGIWYSDAIFHGMCGVGFTTLTQVTDELTRQVKLERSNPQVSLICDENVVNTLQSGQLRFQLAFQRIRQEITAMVAIYRDEVLEQVRRGQVGTDGVGTLDFGRMEFQPKSNYTVKVFLWEDLTQMHPYLPWDDRDVIYVAPYGSNSGDGSVSAPYKTIAKAQSEVRKCNKNMERDMEVRIYPGEYPITSGLNFTSSDSGTNGYRVTYSGANPVEMPTINGGRRI
ncbi:MAG: CBM35 domain-containing protein, partial [Anaerovorax sp.]